MGRERPAMDRDTRLKRLQFRSWHRGTREADYLVGGYFDTRSANWGEDELAAFEVLIEEQDVDILAWAMSMAEPPSHISPALIADMRTLDYIETSR
jgi:antitoxin CptB